MKRLIGAIALASAIAASGSSFAAPSRLRPLSQAMAQENSPSMRLYAAERCSAVFWAANGRMRGSERQDLKNDIASSEASALVFENYARVLAQKNHLNADVKGISNNVAGMAKLYLEDMQDNFLATGNAFGDKFKGDLEMCSSMLKQYLHPNLR